MIAKPSPNLLLSNFVYSVHHLHSKSMSWRHFNFFWFSAHDFYYFFLLLNLIKVSHRYMIIFGCVVWFFVRVSTTYFSPLFSNLVDCMIFHGWCCFVFATVPLQDPESIPFALNSLLQVYGSNLIELCYQGSFYFFINK